MNKTKNQFAEDVKAIIALVGGIATTYWILFWFIPRVILEIK